ncbi:metal-sulfur cluster assembly factor [Inhella sp. 4Y17]|uniref:Metal-sulfur cluster assembly factor n=1 Tax=Inhella gelatinilytica TaxID=2795030 RepID=A0A931IW38_9BURK|nr:metal-sulfur cluster assembly factor [Inhella gelatinilytica]
MSALRQVVDPEVGVNIVDLGLVVGLDWRPEGLLLRLTLTSAACPMGELIADQALAALDAALPEEPPAEVALVWEPAWSPERMSVLARVQLGWPAAQP